MFKPFSDPYLLVAFWAGVLSVMLTLAVAALVIGLRMRLVRQERRWTRFVADWRPLLMSMMVEPELIQLPRLRPGEALMFMRLWSYLHESVRGEAAERLNHTARLLRIDMAARKLLRWGSRPQKLLAILSAGHLRDRLAWDDLRQLATDPDALVSVNAARSLLQIDPLEGARQLMPLIVSRADWDVSRVASFLGPARDAFWLLLVKNILQLPPAGLLRALRLGDALNLSLPAATLRYLLDAAQPAPLVAEALRMAADPELIDEVRRCATHPDRRVREQAVRQLAALAGPGDVPLLAGLLEDSQWPVRLAAVQSLAQLPFLDTAQMQALCRPGSAAEPLFVHVMAERVDA